MQSVLSRRNLLLGSAAAFTAPPVWGAQLPDEVRTQMHRSNSKLLDFLHDDGFDLQVRPGPDGTMIRITGDTVIVDKQRLASLLASPSMAKSKIKSLTLDARVLIIRGPLSLEGGELALLGEEVRFEKGAQIALLPAAVNTPRRLKIISDRLEFSGSGRRPIDLNLISNPNVEVSAAVRTITGTSPTHLWARFVDSLDAEKPPAGIIIAVGAAADETVRQATENQMEWPLFFAAKLRKHFNRNPYDSDIRHEISSIVDQYKPRLESWRDAGPFTIVSAIEAAIRNETDLDGRSFSFTPKQDLISQKQDLETVAVADRFDTLANIIAATVKDNDLAEHHLQRVRAEVATITQKQARIELSVNQNNQKLQILVQRNASTDALINERTRYLALMQQRDFKRMKDSQAVKQWSTIAVSAVVIAGTMGAATPAVAAGAAAGLAVTGEAIYRHNVGAPMTLADAIESGAKTYAAAQAFQESWEQLKANKDIALQVYDGKEVFEGPPPEEGKPDNRKPLTKLEVSKRVLSSLSDAAQKAKAINGDSIAAPTPLTLTERQNEDEDMKALLSRRATDVYDSELLAAQIAASTQELESLINRRLELQTLDVALREGKPENDQQNARWNANARILWGMHVERISRMIATYKKSLYFETGRVPDGVSDVLDYPNELEAQMAAGVLDPLGGFGGTDLQKPVKARLEAEKEKFLASVTATLDAVDVTYTAYLNSRTEADVSRRSVAFSVNAPNSIFRAFLQTLNGQIRQQIVAETPVQMILPAYIPYVLPLSLNPMPERLIRATIVAVEYNIPQNRVGANALEFSIIHPGYGEMKRGNEKFIADLRTSPTDWKYFGVPAEQITREWLTRPPTVIEISKARSDRFYTYYPARAPYFLVVNVRSRNWQSIPEIQAIEIGFEVMQ